MLFLLFSVLIGGFLIHISIYYPFICDDTFISARYADRLVHGQGLTWNNGEWVEGYTNLLWVAGCGVT